MVYHRRDSGRWSAPVHRVASRSAHITVGAGHGRYQARLGYLGPGPEEGASLKGGSCAFVLAQPQRRGVSDRRGGTSRTGAKRAEECDGLTGLPEANAGSPGPRPRSPPVWSTRFRAPGCGLSPTGRAGRSRPLSRPICTAPNQEAAWQALTDFSESDMGVKYPQTVATWERAWERFTPFLDFPPMLRRVISPPLRGRYPLHQRIEAASYQLRKDHR